MSQVAASMVNWMFHYFKRATACPTNVHSSPKEEIHRVNKEVKHAMEQDKMSKKGQGKYNDYTAEKRTKLCKYAAENSTTCSY